MTSPVDAPLVAALAERLAGVRERIEAARRRGAGAGESVALVAVTNSVSPAWITALGHAGVEDVGENRVQAALARRSKVPGTLRWHGIGHLQRNKAADAVSVFDVFHALDSVRLAERLEEVLAAREAAPWPVYLQVNASGEAQKEGVPPDQAHALLERASRLPHLRVLGWMTMAPLGGTEAEVRATFRTLRDVRDEALRRVLGLQPASGLSMGMSDDFEWAVEEGATVVRLGRVLFEGVAPAPGARRPGEVRA
jgi:pyridoxal phosphate enzyme (YggS family)